MIGSPENNFQTMQPPQQEPQPRNVMLGNAMSNQPRQPMQRLNMMPTGNTGGTNPQSWQPSMLAPRQYGNPMPVMPNYEQPQSNASFNMQPQIPNMNQTPQGPIGMNQQGQNRFGVGLARPSQAMPQQTQVS
jgi:hypothetical protein